VAQDYDKIDEFIDNMLEKFQNWVNGKPSQDLGVWQRTPPSSRQGEEKTSGNSSS